LIRTQLQDGDGSGNIAHIHEFSTAQRKDHVGLLTLQERFLKFNPEFHPFLNDTFGTAMNQNVTFGGGPECIHDGGDSACWTGAIVAGTWDFADTTTPQAGTKCVSLTNGEDGDEATFADGTETDFTTHTAVTGQVRLETYNSTVNSIILQFQNNNVDVGNSVNLNDFINTGLLDVYQGFVIPKAAFGIATDTVDEMDMSIVRTGGAKPTFRVDAWQIENTGEPAVFKATTPLGTRFHITELRIALADNVTGVVTNGTMAGLAYDALLGESTLSNGILFRRVEKEETVFAVSIRQLGDFLSTGSNIVNSISDGANTFITLLIEFPEPIVLEGGEDSFLSFTINDNLSGLLQFTAAARGALEI